MNVKEIRTEIRIHKVTVRDGLTRLGCVAALVVVPAVSASAQPVVTGASGSWKQKSTITIQGSNFGTKPTAAPAIWDDCSGTSIYDKWTGGWPSGLSSTYNIGYRTMVNGVPMPHSRITKYLAGAHAGAGGADAGTAVMVWKNRNISGTAYTYASWYYRADPNWKFNLGDPPDNNFKNYAWSNGGEPYVGQYEYIEYNTRFSCATCNDGYWAGHFGYGAQATNLFSQWVKVEMEIKWSQGSDGWAKVWDNGRLVINYTGATDKDNVDALMSGTSRTDAIGGYARSYPSATNWRYFADIYLDYSIARVILGNAATLSASTRREVQVPTAWSTSSISVSANLGAFADGSTAYLYVVDGSGRVNSAGLPVVLGSSMTSIAPPTNVRILR